MERLNIAQHRFVNDVLRVSYDASDNSVLSRD